MGDKLVTKELSMRTWSDYVRFFSQGNGWDHCGCTFAHGIRAPRELRKWSDQRDWNLEVKRALLEEGRTHGVLVYDGGDPIGWCQFGPANELPLSERGPRRRLFSAGEERLWKITCFCTRPDHARRGVASTALRSAVRVIAKRGGGTVEATPVVLVKGDPQTDERLARLVRWHQELPRLIKAHGRFSESVEEHLANRVEVTEQVAGVGPVEATYFGRFNVGTVQMFRREGFQAVSIRPRPRKAYVYPERHPARVVVRKSVSPQRESSRKG